MFFLGILFISVANAIVDNDNNNNNNTNIYDGLNEVDCVAVNSTLYAASINGSVD